MCAGFIFETLSLKPTSLSRGGKPRLRDFKRRWRRTIAMKAIGSGGHPHLAPGVTPLKVDRIGANLTGAEIDAVTRLPCIQFGLADAREFIGRVGKIAESPFANLLENFRIAGTGPGLENFFVKVKKVIGSCWSNLLDRVLSRDRQRSDSGLS